VSYSKVRELTRVAESANEEALLQIALHGTAAHVEKLVRSYRRAQEAVELSREAAQHANRALSYRYDDDGSMILQARLPAELGALLLKAIDMGVDAADFPAGTSNDRPTLSARRADALGMIAESFVSHGAQALNGGDRQLIHLHVCEETLREHAAGCCEIDDGPSMAAETARRLACDASVVVVVENEDGEPLNVGRKTRTISAPLRRLLNARDRGCRFPGCTKTRWVDAHHIEHWANGGETKPSDLVSLCRFHHRMVHEGAVTIHVLNDGALRFVRPDGKALDSVAPDHSRTFDWTHVPGSNQARGLQIDKTTAATLWAGEAMDHDLAVLGVVAAGESQSRPSTDATLRLIRSRGSGARHSPDGERIADEPAPRAVGLTPRDFDRVHGHRLRS
jgi:Domain of unknown function (DUF222)